LAVLIILFILLPTFVFAEVRLIVWQTDSNGPRVVLPQLENESSAAAVERYLQNVTESPRAAKNCWAS
jgi:hypothetical protein